MLTAARTLFAVIPLAVALSACHSPPRNARGAVVPQAMYQPAEASDPYAQTSWALARWASAAGVLRTVPHANDGKQPLTLAFIHERGVRTLAGYSGCNTYSANYTVANGVVLLNTTPVIHGSACADAKAQSIELDYLRGLAGLVGTTTDDYSSPRRLTLTFANGDTLDFARLADPVSGQHGIPLLR